MDRTDRSPLEFEPTIEEAYTLSKSLLFVTGTRADFGKLEVLARAAHGAGFEVTFFVTGMHMLYEYGLTKIEVHRLPGIEVYEFLNQRPSDSQDQILAKTIMGFSDYVLETHPDLIVVHGDRVEAIACSLVAATNYIPLAHIEGGEISGTIDELFRHCNTKLALHHFVSSEGAARRVRALGESAASIHVIGSPELDVHATASGVHISDVRERYALTDEVFGICIFHPVTSEADEMAQQADALFSTLEASQRSFVVIAPNNDPGSEAIRNRIKALPARFRVLPSMRFAHFSEMMKHAACLIGNSSAGVREAPFVGLPSLDIGSRQTARSETDWPLTVSPFDHEAINAFLTTWWGRRRTPETQFGHGESARRFVEVIQNPSFWDQPLQKIFHD